ncbi:MAG: hypothetical protein EOM26_05995 [Alphaproteobacteria bacterium]|nr:hypothetical protein [Alphaproteobacteria bacterium]
MKQIVWYVPIYSATLLLSAFLLFSVQPLFGKMILPLLGGAPSVWNTAMLFFQVTLLAGYAYAHATTKFLGIRRQAGLHLALVLAFMLFLPISLPDGAVPPAGRDPTLWQLGIMATVVGGPFFVLAGTTPMLQRWFAHTPHPDSHNPYFLYAASNLGSVTALLAYPFLIEPIMGLREQAMNWASLYLLLAVLITLSLSLVWSHGREQRDETGFKDDLPDVVTWGRRGMWLLLAFVPSSLMLGVTTYITMDIASAPLFWIMPLALYVGSFIIAFARRPLISYRMAVWLQTLLFAGVVFWTLQKQVGAPVLIFFHLGLFTFTAIACHLDLSRLRPAAKHLTEFYLIMSTGGALGGVFNALIAPNLFLMPIEYPLILALAAFLRFSAREEFSLANSVKRFIEGVRERNIVELGIFAISILLATGALVAITLLGTRPKDILLIIGIACAASILLLYDRRWTFAAVTTAILIVSSLTIWTSNDSILEWRRNFFGIVRITQSEDLGIRKMTHGTTVHGAQPLAEDFRLVPITYYSPFGALGDVYKVFEQNRPAPYRIGAIGLGVGSISCYGREGDAYDYFEIDPDIAEIAQDPAFFTYLRDCPPEYDIHIGDGRVQIARMPDNSYDMIVLDAFSSDNIPVHLLTIEAFELYRDKLKPGGVIAINISNRYMDLKPVVAANARDAGMTALFRFTRHGKLANSEIMYSAVMFAVVTDNADIQVDLRQKGWTAPIELFGERAWTDDYANLLKVILRGNTIEAR